MIRVTLTLDMPEFWGADDTYAQGRGEAVRNLVMEDVEAFAQQAAWQIRKVTETVEKK